MKKLLAILGAVGLTATGASSVVACNNDKHEDKNILDGFKITSGQTGQNIFTNVHKFMLSKYNLKQDTDATKIADYAVWYNGTQIDTDCATQVAKDKTVDVKIILKAADASISNDQKILTDLGFTLGTTYTVSIKVTDKQATTDLSTITFADIDNKVTDNTKVTTDEATNAQTYVKAKVQAAIDAKVAGTVLDTDYTMDLTAIAAGDLHAGVTITDKDTSTILTPKSTNTVKVTFTNN